MNPLLTKLKDRFPDAVLAVREEGPYKDLVAQVKPAAVLEIARFLHDDPEMAFDMLSDILSVEDRKSTRLNSSHGYISYAVFCLKKKKEDVTLLRTSTLAATVSVVLV